MSPRARLRTALALLALAPASLVAEPLRVATLLPFVADAVERVPGHATVVATVRRGVSEPVGGERLDLGTSHQPNLERLAASRAQLVVADARRHAHLATKLRVGGAELLLVETDSVEATLTGLRTVAERIGAEAELGAAVDRVRAELDQIAAAASSRERVLPIFGAPGSFLMATERTWWGDLLARLGYRSVVDGELPESLPGYVQLSDEILAATRVDRVVLLAHGDPPAVARAFAADLARLGRGDLPVEALDPGLFSANPGLRLPEAARALAHLAPGGPR
jgi:iron complex transport system substrate-binding protein